MSDSLLTILAIVLPILIVYLTDTLQVKSPVVILPLILFSTLITFLAFYLIRQHEAKSEEQKKEEEDSSRRERENQDRALRQTVRSWQNTVPGEEAKSRYHMEEEQILFLDRLRNEEILMSQFLYHLSPLPPYVQYEKIRKGFFEIKDFYDTHKFSLWPENNSFQKNYHILFEDWDQAGVARQEAEDIQALSQAEDQKKKVMSGILGASHGVQKASEIERREKIERCRPLLVDLINQVDAAIYQPECTEFTQEAL